jgi:hypothetical protein
LKLAPYLAWKQNNYADQEDRFELLQEFLDLDDIDDYLPPAYRNLSSDLYRD